MALALATLVLGACRGEAPEAVAPPSATEVASPADESTPSDAPAPSVPDLDEVLVGTEVLAEGFTAPVLALARPGTDEVWVVEQTGTVRALAPDGGRTLVLDLGDRVQFGGERGLLGLAFAPDHEATGDFVLHYSREGDGATRVERWTVGADGLATAGAVVLEEAQPAGNHNGGMIAFGPDGMLYVGLGDGGAANDRFGQGQRADTRLGAILRLDLGQEPYGVPADNPFATRRTTADGEPALPEVWAYGLRNPWRFWIDEASGQLVVADVGQNAIEEVTAVPLAGGGANLGWPIREGSRCFAQDPCRSDGLLAPIAEYSHEDGCSITGGVVVRGGAIPGLDGAFLYSDYCSGFLRAVVVDGPERGRTVDLSAQVGELGRVTSFGLDRDGAPLVLSADGTIRRLVAA